MAQPKHPSHRTKQLRGTERAARMAELHSTESIDRQKRIPMPYVRFLDPKMQKVKL